MRKQKDGKTGRQEEQEKERARKGKGPDEAEEVEEEGEDRLQWSEAPENQQWLGCRWELGSQYGQRYKREISRVQLNHSLSVLTSLSQLLPM